MLGIIGREEVHAQKDDPDVERRGTKEKERNAENTTISMTGMQAPGNPTSGDDTGRRDEGCSSMKHGWLTQAVHTRQAWGEDCG